MKTVYEEGTSLLDYRQIESFQGELKDLSEAEYNKLLESFKKHDFFVPEFIWQHEGHNYCLDGHGRQRVLLKEQIEFENTGYQIPVVLIEADNIKDAKEKLLKITSQYQKITQEGLDAYIAQAELPEAEIYQAVSFDALSLLGVSTEEPEVEEDEAPEVDEGGAALSVLGTVYQLGRHRLLVGDSSDFGLISELMDGIQADLVFTDPPYGVNYEGKTKDKLKIQNDTDTNVWAEVLPNYIANTKAGAAFYVCCPPGNNFKDFFLPFEEYCHLAATIIWVKNSLVMGHGDYHYQHEPILYGWNKEGTHKYYGDRSQTTVWNVDRPTKSKEHPTMKPIALIAKAINNSSKESDIVLDLFGGSGSTLIASEQLGRTCYISEIDPNYADVIRKRYAKFVNNNELPDNWAELTPAIGD